MSEKLDLDALARLASGSLATGVDAIDPKDVLRLIGRIRELESQNREWLAANAPGGWIDDLRRELESASQPGGWEAVAWLVDVPDEPELGHWFAEEPAGDGYRSRPLVVAAPSAGNGGAEGDAV